MHSEQINEIADALARAQSEMGNAVLNKTNPHFRSRYADLAAVRDAMLPALNKYGIALTQSPKFHQDGTCALVTTLMHKSGQWISSSLPLPPHDEKPQAFGSALTYQRRYGASAIAFIFAEEDDDANAIQQERAQERKPPQPANDTPIAFAPPIDPLTGLVAPHTINIAREERAKRPNLSYLRHWGGLFIAAIQQAKTPTEIDAWKAANEAALLSAQDDAKLNARIEDSIAQRTSRLGGTSPEQGFLADLDATMKTCRSKKTVETVWSANAQGLHALSAKDHEAAQAIYDTHIKRVGTA